MTDVRHESGGTHAAITLQVDVDEPMTLVVFGTAVCRTQNVVRVSFRVGANAIASPFQAELRDATLPLSLHGKTTLAPGTHLISLMIESDGEFEVAQRLLTALLYRERS
jgi:hypothetical protein